MQPQLGTRVPSQREVQQELGLSFSKDVEVHTVDLLLPCPHSIHYMELVLYLNLSLTKPDLSTWTQKKWHCPKSIRGFFPSFCFPPHPPPPTHLLSFLRALIGSSYEPGLVLSDRIVKTVSLTSVNSHSGVFCLEEIRPIKTTCS